jgi:hypothetical protein
MGGSQFKNEPGTQRQWDVQYNRRTRILVCKGPRQIDFSLTYKGANDAAGPNYTGQDAVCSVYSIL